MAYVGYVCETCNHPHRSHSNIWNCPKCKNETCEACFDRYAHCRSCSVGQSDADLIHAANEEGFEFEEEETNVVRSTSPTDTPTPHSL